jgi:hypothetical protein
MSQTTKRSHRGVLTKKYKVMTEKSKEPKEKVNTKTSETASPTVNETKEKAKTSEASDTKEKSFHVTWNHDSKDLPFALLVNGKKLFSGKKPPVKLIAKGAELVNKLFSKKGGGTIEELTKTVAASKYDGQKLGYLAFICGQALGHMEKGTAKAIVRIANNPVYKKKSKAFETLQRQSIEHGKDQLYAAVSMVISFGIYESQPKNKVTVEKIEVSGEKARKLIQMLEKLSKG